LPIALSFSVSFGLGYYLGSSSGNVHQEHINESYLNPEVEDEEDIPDGDLGFIKAGLLDACKLVFVVRTDLKLTPSDIASYSSQVTLDCYNALTKKNKSLVRHWETTGQAKIALKGKSEDQLLELRAIAKSLNLCARTVKARNVNGVQDGTPVVLGVGPAPVHLINEVTGKLRLL